MDKKQVLEKLMNKKDLTFIKHRMTYQEYIYFRKKNKKMKDKK